MPNDPNVQLLSESHLSGFVYALARRGPIPAAGCAAAMTIAQGIALGLLAVRVTLARNPSSSNEMLKRAERELGDLLTDAIALIDEDAAAVRSWMTTRGVSSRSSAGSSPRSASTSAVSPNAEVPLRVLSVAATALDVLHPVAVSIVRHVRAEVGAAAALLRAGGQTAGLIVRNNVASGDAGRDGQATAKQQRELIETVERVAPDIWRQSSAKPSKAREAVPGWTASFQDAARVRAWP